VKRVAILLALMALLLGAISAAAAPPHDYAAVALDVLPPGENGGVAFDRNTTDQAALYDGLTPLGGKVGPADLMRWFKPETLGLGGLKAVRTEKLPRTGVVIQRDKWDVPHVSGKTQADVEYGTGWATAEDRGLLLELIRGPARAAALDIPGIDPISLALSGKTFVPSPQTEAFLAKQLDLLRAQGPLGRHFVTLLQAYVAGINAYYKSVGTPIEPYTPNDVIAAAALIAARFGANGGTEVSRSMLLSALEKKLGGAKGRQVFSDLRSANDPEAPVSVPGSFPQESPSSTADGSVIVDDGSFKPVPLAVPQIAPASTTMSNALLVGASRSATGHPLFVAGPQVGYFFPEFFMEVDMEGGGFATRGALFPGVPFVVIGRGLDDVWSATSSQADNTDVFIETLCGDDTHYMYKGTCRAMTTFDAGVLSASGSPDQPVIFRETVHGPVEGYATVDGTRVAVSLERSTRGRELLSTKSFFQLDTNQVSSAQSFVKAMAGVEFSFNWFYADDRDIAMYSSGRLAVRAPGTDPALPTDGSGAYDWRGFLTPAQHAQAISPKSGEILNWNNKPAANVGASDDNWSFGPIQRVQLLQKQLDSRKGKLTLADVASAMNGAATQDLRAVLLLPDVAAVLQTGPAPDPRAAQMLQLLEAWAANGASRIDLNLDGKIDDPGAAIMDAVWNRWADAVMTPVLGPALVSRLADLHIRSDDANSGGSSYIDGWYGYVDKDLRTLLGKPVKGAFSTHYCGAGDLAACRASLWAALDAAGAQLAAAQGPDPAAWRADATAERIKFTSEILPTTMRWTNRPTFQQVVTFSGHRPR
jgi:acyl-homoserine lactone acylase PvdQ